jgi:hypothetical protein
MKYAIAIIVIVFAGCGYLLYQVKNANTLLIDSNVSLSAQNIALQEQVNSLVEALDISQGNTKNSLETINDMMSTFNMISLVDALKQQNDIRNKMIQELSNRGMTQEEFDKTFGEDLKKLKKLIKISHDSLGKIEKENKDAKSTVAE